jgi:sucrose-6-phosphate hydrolase SacC (GH32 family)
VEVFANDGEVTITDRIFPGPESLGIEITGEVRDLRVWPLRSVWQQR